MTRGTAAAMIGLALFAAAVLMVWPWLSADRNVPADQPALGYSPGLVQRIVKEAEAEGDAARGAEVFRAAQFACLSCHPTGDRRSKVGPNLADPSPGRTPEFIVESVLWPKRQVDPAYVTTSIATASGKTIQGYRVWEDEQWLVLRDPPTGEEMRVAKEDIDGRREIGTLMPDDVVARMSDQERSDLLKFLFELQGGGRRGT